jgi:hypothetical protein
MYNYEKNLLYAETMNKISEFMEEIILAAMISALRNIKECEQKSSKSFTHYQDEDIPF